jgi:replicative DNA helicase
MLAAQSQVDGWKLRTGKVTNNDDFDSIRVALEQMAKAPIYIDDEAGKDLLSMRSVARRLKSEKDIGLIIVDYLQLASPSKTSGSDSMVQQVTELSRGMKSMAREVNVPVVCLSQLSRGVEQRGGKPRLSDLRDSGSIEQDADLVMFIHNESKFKEDAEKTNITEILIEKHRNGPTGSVELYFDNAKTSFRDIDGYHGSGTGDGFEAF